MTPQQQIEALKKQADNYLSYLEAEQYKAFNKLFEGLDKSSDKSVKLLKTYVAQLEDMYLKVEDKARGVYEGVKAVTIEQQKVKDHVRSIIREYGVLNKASRALSDHEAEINILTKGQLSTITNKIRSSQRELSILRENLKVNGKINELGGIYKEMINDTANQYEQVLSMSLEQYKALGRYNSALGVTGALLDNVNKIGIRAFGGIGINLGILGEGLETAKVAAEDMARNLTRSDSHVVSFTDRFKVLKAALPGIREGVIGALSDPLVTITALSHQILNSFLKYNQSSIELSRYTGQTAEYSDLMNTRFVTGAELMSFMAASSKELGINVKAVFDKDTLSAAAEYTKLLGLSTTEASKLAIFSTLNKNTLGSNVQSLVKTVNIFNELNRTAVVHGQVLRDVSNVSDSIAASMGTNVIRLTQAAAMARKLGIELSDLNSIASTLLDFETSIEDELTAQLLTGKSLNLSKARELALTNDLLGVGKEIFKNSMSLQQFGNLTRIGQEGYAKALGLSRDQLARIAYLQALNSGMTEKQAASMAKVNVEDMKRISAQESITTSMNKLAEALAPILDSASRLLGTTQGMAIMLGSIVTLIGVKFYLGITNARRQAALLAVVMKQVENSTRNTAVYSNMIKPAYPGAAVGRGPGGRFTSMKTSPAAGIGQGLQTAGSVVSMAGPHGRIAGLIMGGIGTLLSIVAANNMMNTPSISDGVISPSGGLLVSGPKGSIKTSPDDYLIATTNKPGTSSSNENVLRKLDELIEAVNRRGDIYLDGNKVGQALVLGTSQFS